MKSTFGRLSYAFLCATPFVAIVAAAVRALRVPGLYQAIGGLLFAAIATAAWSLGARAMSGAHEGRQRLALAGGLLVMPFALVSLLWVGLATPWDATPAENVMRYFVLLAMSIAVAAGFVVLQHALSDAGERLYSTVGFAANMLAGGGYLVWTSVMLGYWAMRTHDTARSATIIPLVDAFDVLLFVASILTYAATAAFAASLRRAQWIRRGAARVYVTVNVMALLLLAVRGLSFPDPTASSTPWYFSAGFIIGIPAVPWIMPALLGAALLRRAGAEQQ
jgi:hypothetical protein